MARRRSKARPAVKATPRTYLDLRYAMARAELRAARKINQALARIRAEVDAVLASSLPAGGAR